MSRPKNFEELAEAKELNRYNRSRAITLKASISKDYSLGEAISFLEKVANERFDKNVKKFDEHLKLDKDFQYYKSKNE